MRLQSEAGKHQNSATNTFSIPHSLDDQDKKIKQVREGTTIRPGRLVVEEEEEEEEEMVVLMAPLRLRDLLY